MSQSTPAADDGASGKACPADCRTCSAETANPPAAGALTGWRLGVAAVGAFLLPLAAATAGAIVAGPERQLIGCLVGLAGGVMAASLAARVLRRPSQDRQ